MGNTSNAISDCSMEALESRKISTILRFARVAEILKNTKALTSCSRTKQLVQGMIRDGISLSGVDSQGKVGSHGLDGDDQGDSMKDYAESR